MGGTAEQVNPASTSAIEDRFKALAENSSEVFVEVGPDSKLTYVSPNVSTVFGIDAAELSGLSLRTIASRLEVSPKEDLHGFAGPLALSQLVSRGPYQRIRHIRLPQGGERWIDIAVTQFVTEKGQTRVSAVIRDITAHMHLEEQLVRGQKLESLSVLAGGSAHRFNNQLTTILLNVELAISEAEGTKNSKILPYLWSVVEAAARAEETTHQLLTYAGQHAVEMSGLDLTSEIRSMRSFLRSIVGGRAALEFDLQNWLPKVQADGKQLNQLLTHLTLNAVEACDQGQGRVVISTGILDLEENSAEAIRTGLPPGKYAFAAVSDNGEGVEPELQLKVFDPFFTTRTGSGGLGLAESLGIARAHGGTIIVDSRQRHGATFKLLLPICEKLIPLAAVDPEPAHAGERMPRGGLILVVDDEDYIRRLAAVGLRRSGYEVLSANSGREAIALFSEYADQVDLLITDLAMPEMNGEELILKLRRTHPDLPVLLMSGYSQSAVSEGIVDRPGIGFLQKPFLLSELAACASRMLHVEDQSEH